MFFFRIPVWLLWHRSRPINKAWRPTADVAPRTKDSKDARSGFPFPLFLPQCWAQTNAKVISWLADCCLPPCKKSKSSLAECVAALNSCSQHTKNTADPQPSCRFPFDPLGSPWIAPLQSHSTQLNSWTHAASRHMEEKLLWRGRPGRGQPTMKTTTKTCIRITHTNSRARPENARLYHKIKIRKFEKSTIGESINLSNGMH